MITVRIRSILTMKRILGKEEFDMSLPEGSTLDDLLSSMIRGRGDELSSRLVNLDGRGPAEQARVTRVMINGRDIEFLNGLETVLHEGDEILILPILSGG